MKKQMAIGKRIIDKGTREKVILIRPKLSWFFNRKHWVMITKEDFDGEENDIEYY